MRGMRHLDSSVVHVGQSLLKCPNRLLSFLIYFHIPVYKSLLQSAVTEASNCSRTIWSGAHLIATCSVWGLLSTAALCRGKDTRVLETWPSLLRWLVRIYRNINITEKKTRIGWNSTNKQLWLPKCSSWHPLCSIAIAFVSYCFLSVPSHVS